MHLVGCTLSHAAVFRQHKKSFATKIFKVTRSELAFITVTAPAPLEGQAIGTLPTGIEKGKGGGCRGEVAELTLSVNHQNL